MQKCPNLQDSNLWQKSWCLYDTITIYHTCFVESVELRFRENSLWIMCFRYGSSALRGWSPWRINLRNDLVTYELATRYFAVKKPRALREMKHLQAKHPLFWQREGHGKKAGSSGKGLPDTVMQIIETKLSDWQTNGSCVCRCYGQSWGSLEMLRTTPRGGSRHWQAKYAYCQCNCMIAGEFEKVWYLMSMYVKNCIW